MHTCKSGVARESLSGTAQHEHAGAPPLCLAEPVDSFSDFGDTGFHPAEVLRYPDPPHPNGFEL